MSSLLTYTRALLRSGHCNKNVGTVRYNTQTIHTNRCCYLGFTSYSGKRLLVRNNIYNFNYLSTYLKLNPKDFPIKPYLSTSGREWHVNG